MSRDPGEMPSGADTRRELWTKLILLSVAFALTVAYAATRTEFGTLIWDEIRPILKQPLLMAGLGCLFAVVAGALILRGRRGGSRESLETVGDNIPPVAGRARFLTLLAAQCASHAKSGRQLAIHLIDIDRFSAINKVLGEKDGDAFLRNIAERLLGLVEHPDRLARIGDDEFVVIQPETGGARHAEIFGRRIHELLKDVGAKVPRHARPGVSIGVAVSPEHGSDAQDLFRSAGLAVRAAKDDGGDQVRVYAREMAMSIEARLQMEQAIADGLNQGWFELRFQPQYDLRNRRLTGFEALVRMRHPELGELLPHAFLPAALEGGLMQPLGDWIIREALAAATEWPPQLALSLNVSPIQFVQGDVAANLLQAMSRSGFDGSRLRIEICEAVLLENSAATLAQLRRLQVRGAHIVIDDFGLGNSSLRSLSLAPCEAVKIDRTLVQRIGEDPEVENLIRGLIGTARSFGLAVFGEGIERAEQVFFLISHGCNDVQGFLFGRPAHKRDLATIIAKDLRNTVAEGQKPRSGDRASAA